MLGDVKSPTYIIIFMVALSWEKICIRRMVSFLLYIDGKVIFTACVLNLRTVLVDIEWLEFKTIFQLGHNFWLRISMHLILVNCCIHVRSWNRYVNLIVSLAEIFIFLSFLFLLLPLIMLPLKLLLKLLQL